MKKQHLSDRAVANPAYVLGHAGRELERLIIQERAVGPFTRQILQDAGITLGMRVLDVGSGAGDVAFLAADLVGHGGEVIGTDNAPAAVAAARARASEKLLQNVGFREGDPTEMVFERPFDAVVGRYVLTFQADPASMLRKLACHLRPGGVLVFHEPDWDGARSFPPSSTYDLCNQWIVKTFQSLGIETRMGIKLHETFVAAGLQVPSMRFRAIIGGGEDASAWMYHIAELVSTMLPAIEKAQVATAAEVNIKTLADRLHRDLEQTGGLIIGRSEIGAWSRL